MLKENRITVKTKMFIAASQKKVFLTKYLLGMARKIKKSTCNWNVKVIE